VLTDHSEMVEKHTTETPLHQRILYACTYVFIIVSLL